MNNPERIGRFTSSQMHRLMSNGRSLGSVGQPFYTYVDEKRNERNMGVSFDSDPYTKSIAWGNFMELYLHGECLGSEYRLTSKGTLVHPDYEYWAGTPDCEKFKNGELFAISEIKCYQPKKFADYTNAIKKQDVGFLRDNFKQEYYQVVSNACILNVDYGEVISFMPYASQMDNVVDKNGDITSIGIREIINALDDFADQNKYRFIVDSPNHDLAVLPDGGFYKNINKFMFEIPKEDKEKLTERVELASKEIQKK